MIETLFFTLTNVQMWCSVLHAMVIQMALATLASRWVPGLHRWVMVYHGNSGIHHICTIRSAIFDWSENSAQSPSSIFWLLTPLHNHLSGSMEQEQNQIINPLLHVFHPPLQGITMSSNVVKKCHQQICEGGIVPTTLSTAVPRVSLSDA